MSKPADLKKEIVKKLSALDLINKVYNFEDINPTGFPCAFVTLGNHDNEFSSTSENRRTWIFRVLIMVLGGANYDLDSNRQAAEQQLLDIIEQVIDDFDMDISLGGQALFVDAAVSAPSYYGYEGGQARGCEIFLNCHTDKTVV